MLLAGRAGSEVVTSEIVIVMCCLGCLRMERMDGVSDMPDLRRVDSIWRAANSIVDEGVGVWLRWMKCCCVR